MLTAVVSLALATTYIRETTEPITDSAGVYLVVRSGEQYISVGCSDTKDRKSFVAKAAFAQYIGDARAGLVAGGRPIEYRFDGGKSYTLLWHSHADYLFATAPEARPVQFATELRTTRRLVMRAYDSLGGAKLLDLSYDDPSSRLDEVLGRCGFNSDGSKRRPAP